MQKYSYCPLFGRVGLLWFVHLAMPILSPLIAKMGLRNFYLMEGGFLFKSNNSESLNKAFDKFINSSEQELFFQKLVAKKQVKKFTFSQLSNFVKVLN